MDAPLARAPRALKGRKILVTGGAGFIGSHAVDRLVAEGAHVTVVDDLSAGKEEFLAQSRSKITFVRADCGDPNVLTRVLPGMDSVWHMAANPDVRTGESNPGGHYRANVELTFRLLEGMRRHGVRHIAFTSTSTVYGAAAVIPTPEGYGPLLPISMYGACKLAGEALISAYGATYGIDGLLFRFANVVGPRSTHGVIYDFARKLRADPNVLEILGDGQQTKSYVSVADTVDAMVHAARHAPPGVQPYNIGSRDALSVVELADTVTAALGVRPRYKFSGGTPDGAGWKGDVKRMGLALDRLKGLGPGWEPRHTSKDAVRITAESLAQTAPSGTPGKR